MAHDDREGAKIIGETVRRERVALDLTKAEAARRAGVSRRTWHEIEDGLRPSPTAVTLAQFEQVLGMADGTLYEIAISSTSAQVEALRRRAQALVRNMTGDDLAAFVEANGTGTLREIVTDMRAELAAFAMTVEGLSKGLTEATARELAAPPVRGALGPAGSTDDSARAGRRPRSA